MKALDRGEMEAHTAEARARWGNTNAYKEHLEKTKSYGKEKWNALAGELDAIFGEFALCLKAGEAPGGARAQALVEKLQSHITDSYYTCTKEILSGLGQMYVGDERFTNNIDRHAEGTAAFVGKAIARFCADNTSAGGA